MQEGAGRGGGDSRSVASHPFSTTGGQLAIKMAAFSPQTRLPQPPRTPRENKYLNIRRHSKQPSLNWISPFYRLSLPKCQKSVGLGEPFDARAPLTPLPAGPAHPLHYQLTQSLPPSCLLCGNEAAEPTQAARISLATSADHIRPRR